MRRERFEEFYYRWGNAVFGILAFFVMMFILFAGNNVGLSDQGDFNRVMYTASLTHETYERGFVFIDRYIIFLVGDSAFSNGVRILFSADGLENYPSLHVVLVRISVVINLFINSFSSEPLYFYRLPVLGAMTAAIYAVLLFWLFCQLRFRSPILDGLAKIFIIFIACDIGYIAYFNSFYSESLQILGLAMIVVAALRIFRKLYFAAPAALAESNTVSSKGGVGLWDYGLIVIASIVYGWSKILNLPIGILVIAAFGVIVVLGKKAGRKMQPDSCAKTAVAALTLNTVSLGFIAKVAFIAAMGIVPLILVWVSIPSHLDNDTNFNSVFFGIIKHVDEATAIQRLEALGLSPEMAQFASFNRYVDGVAGDFRALSFEEEFFQISKFDLLWFYVRHPSLALEGVRMRIAHSGLIRPWYLANYSHARMQVSTRFSGWTQFRVHMGFDTVYGNIVLWLGFAGAVLVGTWGYMKEKGKLPVLLLLTAVIGAGFYSLFVQMVANGEADVAKQMFLYIQIVDVVFVAVVLLLLAALHSIAILKRSDNSGILLHVRAAICTLAIVILVLPALASLAPVARRPVSLDEAGVGDFVYFGHYDGRDILWRVVGETVYSRQLMAADNIAYKPFDSANSNRWEFSDLRAWLNEDFLAEAFGDDADSILPASRYVLLTAQTAAYAGAGDRPFYAFHIPRYAFRGTGRAYRVMVYDQVRLPCAGIMDIFLDNNWRHGGGYWMEIPRFLDGMMVRYVSRDGFIFVRDADNLGGVRPVIEVCRRVG